MRDYEINVAQSRQAYGQVTWLVRLVQNWRVRKTLRLMRHFNEYQLRDIGLMRDELERLIALPLDCDHALEAERSLLASYQLYAVSKTGLALPNLGRAALPLSEQPVLEQPARNLGGVVHIGLAKKLNEITLLSSQNG